MIGPACAYPGSTRNQYSHPCIGGMVEHKELRADKAHDVVLFCLSGASLLTAHNTQALETKLRGEVPSYKIFTKDSSVLLATSISSTFPLCL